MTRASRAPAVKPRDVQRIISTPSGGFVYVYVTISCTYFTCLQMIFPQNRLFR